MRDERRERAMFREQDINSAAFAYYRRLGRVQRFVDEHYADRITLEKAADIACLDKKYFLNLLSLQDRRAICGLDLLGPNLTRNGINSSRKQANIPRCRSVRIFRP